MERVLALARSFAILFISSEISEVVRVSHRIAVLRDRRKVAELTGADASEEQVYRLIAGGQSRRGCARCSVIRSFGRC